MVFIPSTFLAVDSLDFIGWPYVAPSTGMSSGSLSTLLAELVRSDIKDPTSLPLEEEASGSSLDPSPAAGIFASLQQPPGRPQENFEVLLSFDTASDRYGISSSSTSREDAESSSPVNNWPLRSSVMKVFAAFRMGL